MKKFFHSSDIYIQKENVVRLQKVYIINFEIVGGIFSPKFWRFFN